MKSFVCMEFGSKTSNDFWDMDFLFFHRLSVSAILDFETWHISAFENINNNAKLQVDILMKIQDDDAAMLDFTWSSSACPEWYCSDVWREIPDYLYIYDGSSSTTWECAYGNTGPPVKTVCPIQSSNSIAVRSFPWNYSNLCFWQFDLKCLLMPLWRDLTP